jgi:hypothetical protein
MRSRENQLRELGARGHSVGRPRELRGIEGRRDAHDEKRSRHNAFYRWRHDALSRIRNRRLAAMEIPAFSRNLV